MDQIEEWQEKLRKELEKVKEELQSFEKMGALSPIPFLEKPSTVEQNFLSIVKKIEQGMKKLIAVSFELHTLDPKSVEEGIFQTISHMMACATALMINPSSATEALREGKSLQEILEIDDDGLHAFYKLARYLFEHQHYEESASAFYFLALLNPSFHSFWMGLGHSEYLLGHWELALPAYTFAAQTDPLDPHSHLFQAKCHKAMKNKDAFFLSLSLAELAPDDPKVREEVKKQIALLTEGELP